MIGLLFEEGRAVGVEAKDGEGRQFSACARLVIGADGPASMVAKCVGATEHHVDPPLQSNIWSYWRDVPVNHLHITIREGAGAFAFPSSDGTVLVAANLLHADFLRSRRRKEPAFHAMLKHIAPDLAAKLAGRAIDIATKDLDARQSERWANTDISKARKTLEATRTDAVEALRLTCYFVKQADWLQERFPEALLCDVEGLVKRVNRAKIEEHDWSLTPGRYVGVAPEEEDEDFDFEETLREIRVALLEADVAFEVINGVENRNATGVLHW